MRPVFDSFLAHNWLALEIVFRWFWVRSLTAGGGRVLDGPSESRYDLSILGGGPAQIVGKVTWGWGYESVYMYFDKFDFILSLFHSFRHFLSLFDTFACPKFQERVFSK